MIPVTVTIQLQGYFCNHWPYVKILVNDQVMADLTVEDLQTVEFTVNCDKINILCFQHYGKSFGENGIYDTSGNEDCKFQILDIKFDRVSIGEKIRSQLVFNNHWSQFQLNSNSTEFIQQFSHIENSDGWMTFNGEIGLEFDTPIYDWLIIKKFKVPLDQGKSFHSNYTTRWHYEENIETLNEIRKLMKLNENSNSSNS